jgi:hypothetical protein
LIAEEVLKQHQKRIESFLFENAEDRYLDFIKTFPKNIRQGIIIFNCPRILA